MSNACSWVEDSQGQWYAQCQEADPSPLWLEAGLPDNWKYCPHCSKELDATEFDDSEMIDDGHPPEWNRECNPHGYVGHE